MPLRYEALTARILEASFEVSSELGAGFVESVYQNALLITLQEKGLEVARELPLHVKYKGQNIGSFFAGLVVDHTVLVELKAVSALLPEHKAQVINYLKASGLEVGLLINFGRAKIEYHRLEHPNLRLKDTKTESRLTKVFLKRKNLQDTRIHRMDRISMFHPGYPDHPSILLS